MCRSGDPIGNGDMRALNPVDKQILRLLIESFVQTHLPVAALVRVVYPDLEFFKRFACRSSPVQVGKHTVRMRSWKQYNVSACRDL